MLGGLEGTIRDGLGEGIAKVLFPLAAAFVGGWLVITADRRTPREQARKAGTVVLLGVSVILVGVWTLTLGPRLDDQVTRAVTWVNATINRTPTDSDPGREIGESLRTNLIEPTWRFGMFGTVDSPIAKDFGPRLLHNSAISNQERADLSADPAAQERSRQARHRAVGPRRRQGAGLRQGRGRPEGQGPTARLPRARGLAQRPPALGCDVGWISFWGVGRHPVAGLRAVASGASSSCG